MFYFFSLGVGQSKDSLVMVICSPVGPYYKTGFSAVSLYADGGYVRAWYNNIRNTILIKGQVELEMLKLEVITLQELFLKLLQMKKDINKYYGYSERKILLPKVIKL